MQWLQNFQRQWFLDAAFSDYSQIKADESPGEAGIHLL
jgi:hypothetical protein